jgi:hypothetical protein
MRHKPLLDHEAVYTAGVISLGLLSIALTAAVLFMR